MKGVKERVRRKPVHIYLNAIEYTLIREASVLMQQKTSQFIRNNAITKAKQILNIASKITIKKK